MAIRRSVISLWALLPTLLPVASAVDRRQSRVLIAKAADPTHGRAALLYRAETAVLAAHIVVVLGAPRIGLRMRRTGVQHRRPYERGQGGKCPLHRMLLRSRRASRAIAGDFSERLRARYCPKGQIQREGPG